MLNALIHRLKGVRVTTQWQASNEAACSTTLVNFTGDNDDDDDDEDYDDLIDEGASERASVRARKTKQAGLREGRPG